MRRPLIFTLVGLTALGSAGIALGHGLGGGLKTSTAAATFAAAPSSSITSKTCTGSDGTYVITKGSWTGTAASSNSRLSGAIRIHGELGVNQTTGLGWLVARVRIDAGSDGSNDAGADLRGVVANGKLTGFLNGHIQDEGAVYGSVAATVGATGFSDGQIGGGTPTAAAVVIDRGSCTPATVQRAVVSARGTLTAVSATSLTLQGFDNRGDHKGDNNADNKGSSITLTCAVGSDLAATVAKLKVGDAASVTCGLVDGSYRLLRIESRVLTPKPVISGAGAVTAVSATSLSVKTDGGDTFTCVVGSDFAAAAAKLAVGNRVHLTCASVDGSYRVIRLVAAETDARPVISVEGRISSISATSLTVDAERGSQTCSIGTDLAADAARVSVGQKVKATCGLVDGSYRLLSLRANR